MVRLTQWKVDKACHKTTFRANLSPGATKYKCCNQEVKSVPDKSPVKCSFKNWYIIKASCSY